MEQKILFFDIDGTLIMEESGEMPQSTREALDRAKTNGHLLFINTGRTRASLPSKLLEIGFDGYVCGCGTNIFLNDKEIFKAKLTNKLCREVVREVRKYKIPVFYEASDAIYFDPEMPDLDDWIKAAEETFDIQGKDIEEVLTSNELVYDKLLMILEPTEKNQELKEYLSQNFLCIDRLHNMYEVIQKDYSKATGIQFICEHLGKMKEDCYVFGDSENDRAMLEAVPNSVAMGNAEDAIKKSCSYVTESIENNGIFNAMKHFKLI